MIGVGVITCDRPTFYRTCIDSISEGWYDHLVTVNDGEDVAPQKGEYIRTTGGIGVGRAKNKALRYLLDKGCDYIILVEDDMKFKKNIFQAYVEAYKKTGIQHFMFAYHGPANKAGISGGRPVPRKVIDYGDMKISLNQHCVGAVTFYTRESLEVVGLNDEEFNKNNFEHVEHSYRLAKGGFSTPYWWWADLANSLDYVEEQACSETNSSIKRDNWADKVMWSAKLFEQKHGYMPAWNNAVPDTPQVEVISLLKLLHKTTELK